MSNLFSLSSSITSVNFLLDYGPRKTSTIGTQCGANILFIVNILFGLPYLDYLLCLIEEQNHVMEMEEGNLVEENHEDNEEGTEPYEEATFKQEAVEVGAIFAIELLHFARTSRLKFETFKERVRKLEDQKTIKLESVANIRAWPNPVSTAEEYGSYMRQFKLPRNLASPDVGACQYFWCIKGFYG